MTFFMCLANFAFTFIMLCLCLSLTLICLMFCLFTFLIVDVFSQTSKEMPRGIFLSCSKRRKAEELLWKHVVYGVISQSKQHREVKNGFHNFPTLYLFIIFSPCPSSHLYHTPLFVCLFSPFLSHSFSPPSLSLLPLSISLGS